MNEKYEWSALLYNTEESYNSAVGILLHHCVLLSISNEVIGDIEDDLELMKTNIEFNNSKIKIPSAISIHKFDDNVRISISFDKHEFEMKNYE